MKFRGSAVATLLVLVTGCGSELSAEEACDKAKAVAAAEPDGDRDVRVTAAARRDELREISDESSADGRAALAPAIEAFDFIVKNGDEGYQANVTDGLNATVEACGWN